MIYFTSDLHLNHARIIELANRPFGSVEEMNDTIIGNINDTVGADDTLWVLTCIWSWGTMIPGEERSSSSMRDS